MFSLVFPGQGSQTIGMGKDFFENYDLVKDLFEQETRHWELIFQK